MSGTLKCLSGFKLSQGVNSALEDIAVLESALQATGDVLSEALPLYEHERSPDIRALIRLMQFGYPHQVCVGGRLRVQAG